MPDRRVPGWLTTGPATLAHRGGAALGPENSLATLSAARAAGAHAVEIDITETADGGLILYHDSFAISGDEWLWVRDLTIAELNAIVGALPTLTELLDDLAGAGFGLYLDVKAVSPAGVGRIIERVVGSGLANSTVIASFRHDIPAQVAADGRVAASVLFRDEFCDPVALAADLGCAVIHPCFDGNDGMIDLMGGEWMERVHAHGVKLVGWNTNDPGVIRRMIDAGFDAICTDDPRLVEGLAPPAD